MGSVTSIASTSEYYMFKLYPNDRFCGLRVGRYSTSYDFRALFRFIDYIKLPNINNMKLYLYLWDNSENISGMNINIYSTKKNWSSYVTWNNYDSGLSWQTAGAFGENDIFTTSIGNTFISSSATQQYFEIDINESYFSYINESGFLIAGSPVGGSGGVYFANSSASNVNILPKLYMETSKPMYKLYNSSINGMMYNLSPTTSYTTGSLIIQGTCCTPTQYYYGVLNFYLDCLKQRNILSAHLAMKPYKTGLYGQYTSLKFYRLKKSWNEHVTWNSRNSIDSWEIGGASGSSDCEQNWSGSAIFNSSYADNYSYTPFSASIINEMVSGSFTNNGFLVKGTAYEFYGTKNAVKNYQPYFIIVCDDYLPSQEYDSYTKSLLHFDTSGSQYYFKDEIGNPWTAFKYKNTAGSGAYISTDQHKFGDASGYFIGNNPGYWIETPTDFEFGSQDFTIEGQFYASDLNPIDYNKSLFGESITGDNNQNFQGLCLTCKSASGTDFYFRYAQSVSGSAFMYTGSSPVPITTNTWNHIAFIRHGNDFNAYFNGVSYFHFTSSSPIPTLPSSISYPQTFKIGQVGFFGWWNGYIDEFRLSIGTARWTGDFTPPTQPYEPITTGITNFYQQPVMFSQYPWI